MKDCFKPSNVNLGFENLEAEQQFLNNEVPKKFELRNRRGLGRGKLVYNGPGPMLEPTELETVHNPEHETKIRKRKECGMIEVQVEPSQSTLTRLLKTTQV